MPGTTSPRVRRVLTTRAGGASAPPYSSFNLGGGVGDDPESVAANRARLAAATQVSPDRLVWMEQVHGRTVAVVDSPRTEAVPVTDGLVTAVPDLVLVVLAADCVPVLLADPEAGVVGAVHAGRQGVRLNIAERAVAAMTGLGAEPERIEALLGPAVCGACYEVPADMQADVEKHAPGSARRTRKGTAGLDLREGLRGQLERAGIARIIADQRCTVEDPDLFSHRRDQLTGRQAGLVWLASA